MSEYKLQSKLLDYVNAATDLAESVKLNIKHSKKGVAVIDDKTALALNKFMTAANALKDLPDQLLYNTIKFN